jgi:predicted XRE-type DNA-binding protein
MSEPIEVFVGSGNVFADLGLPYPEERLVKARLSILIDQAIEALGLTHAEAAELLGTTEPDLSDVLRGSLSDVPMDRLFRFVNAFGMDVEVRISPAVDGEVGRLSFGTSGRSE